MAGDSLPILWLIISSSGIRTILCGVSYNDAINSSSKSYISKTVLGKCIIYSIAPNVPFRSSSNRCIVPLVFLFAASEFTNKTIGPLKSSSLLLNTIKYVK